MPPQLYPKRIELHIHQNWGLMQFYAFGIQLRRRMILQITQKYFQAINHNP